jgi:pimeloyl-ACP methyl ester carboxylesterase
MPQTGRWPRGGHFRCGGWLQGTPWVRVRPAVVAWVAGLALMALPTAGAMAAPGAAAASAQAWAWPADGPPCTVQGPDPAPAKSSSAPAGSSPLAAPAQAVPATQTIRPPGPLSARLPGVRYACLRLADGSAVLAGLAGPVDPQAAATVLLVHGLGQNAHRDWAPTVQALVDAGGYRVLVLDLPGFGASPPTGQGYAFAALDQVLLQVLDQAAPGGAVHVVGHSLGGAVALHLAHRQPGRVASLVLVDAAGVLLKPVFVHELARQGLPRVGISPVDRLLGFVEDRVNGLQSWLLLGNDDRYDFVPWLVRHPDVRQALLGGLVQVDAALGLVEHDFSAALREVQAPTTVIWGEHDRVAPLRTGQVLAARLPNARLQVVPGAGHTPMLEQPAEFHRRLLAALAGLGPLAGAGGAGGAVDAVAVAPSQGHGVCQGRSGQRFSGRYDSLSLQDCGQVQVQDAWIGRLVLRNSTVRLLNSVVHAGDGAADQAAVDALDSELTATASRVQGPVALRSENSFFDLAGVSLRANGPVLDLRGRRNRLFLSVSDWQGSDLQGDAHFIWPRP